jgi:hypothetical protein
MCAAACLWVQLRKVKAAAAAAAAAAAEERANLAAQVRVGVGVLGGCKTSCLAKAQRSQNSINHKEWLGIW